MPLERRKEIYAIASKYDLFIYEDDPYGEIRFAGEHIPTFKSFDTENRVLFTQAPILKHYRQACVLVSCWAQKMLSALSKR